MLDHPLDLLEGANMASNVANKIRAATSRQAESRVKGVDKSDRATVEQAIDPRTRMVSAAVNQQRH